VREAGAFGQPRARDAKVLVNDADLIGTPAQGDRALDEAILPVGRLAVVLDLSCARLANVDEGAAGKMG
jgi:hypothetical protein